MCVCVFSCRYISGYLLRVFVKGIIYLSYVHKLYLQKENNEAVRFRSYPLFVISTFHFCSKQNKYV